MKKMMCVLMMALMIGSASAMFALNHTLSPADLTDAADATDATAFAYDWDQDAPIGSTTVGGAPGYGDSAWYSDVQGSAAGGPRDYTAFRLFPKNIVAEDAVTVAELDGLSLWTNWESGLNWQIKIYTKPEAGDTGWYRNRINLNRCPEVAGWTQSDTTGLGVEWIHNKTANSSVYNKTYAEMQAAYGLDEILWIDIIAGYASNSPAAYAYLDGVELTVNGTTATMDLIVPEPATLALLGLGGLLLRKRK